MTPRALAALALALGIGTVVGWVVLLALLGIPVRPAWYLAALTLAVALALAAVWRSRRWLPLTALVATLLLLGLAGFVNFVAMRVPAGRPLFVVGQPAPDFTLPDAAGRTVTLSGYRGHNPVVLVFYRGYW